MASHVQSVTRRVITRKAGDIDPKIAGVFAVAAGTIAIAVVAVIAVHLLGGTVDVAAVITPILPVLVAAAVGWIRKSTHAELIEEGVDDAAALATALEPVLVQLAPAAAPAVHEAVDGIEVLEHALRPAPTQP